MSDYPPHAAHIWIAGDQIFMGLPPVDGRLNHTIAMKATPAGLAALLKVLQERARHINKIGTPANPTQWDVNKLLKEADDEVARRKKEAEDFLKEVGL